MTISIEKALQLKKVLTLKKNDSFYKKNNSEVLKPLIQHFIQKKIDFLYKRSIL